MVLQTPVTNIMVTRNGINVLVAMVAEDKSPRMARGKARRQEGK
jgi:hypothetical protein